MTREELIELNHLLEKFKKEDDTGEEFDVEYMQYVINKSIEYKEGR